MWEHIYMLHNFMKFIVARMSRICKRFPQYPFPSRQSNVIYTIVIGIISIFTRIVNLSYKLYLMCKKIISFRYILLSVYQRKVSTLVSNNYSRKAIRISQFCLIFLWNARKINCRVRILLFWTSVIFTWFSHANRKVYKCTSNFRTIWTELISISHTSKKEN